MWPLDLLGPFDVKDDLLGSSFLFKKKTVEFNGRTQCF
jgi:hypothetical protein